MPAAAARSALDYIVEKDWIHGPLASGEWRS
jgi:hypothetical protein